MTTTQRRRGLIYRRGVQLVGDTRSAVLLVVGGCTTTDGQTGAEECKMETTFVSIRVGMHRVNTTCRPNFKVVAA